jgi:transportin-1
MAFILSGAIRVTLGLKENAAITLGRVAWMAPAEIAPHLGHFCGPWCKTLRSVRDDIEKEHAFTGLVRVVRLNPEPAANSFAPLAG